MRNHSKRIIVSELYKGFTMNSEPIHNILRTYYPLNNLLKRTDSKE